MAQRSITNFFKKSTAKRNNAEDESVDPKRQKTDELQSDVNVSAEKLGSLDPTLSNVGTTWFNALKSEFSKDYFGKLCSFLEVERKNQTIYPPAHQVYTWTQMCKVNDVKVVILGQDPYHGPKQAHGLCFSVQKGVPPPPSLKNMYKELKTDIPGFEAPTHGDLTGWAKQGVLLLNACLTVRANNANSHAGKGWEDLTDAVIKYLDQSCNNIVFLLWGAYAEKKGSVIKNKSHLVLRTTHPSPLSAHRGFLGCKHFSQTNAFLEKVNRKPIDWNHLP
ncbi:uracil-DNA glycosylase-like isoform X2 [Bradysia coprophila]|nr:uracil-DNA glycosylase-like isoform X2 [Bradysia coprophila]